MADNENIIDRLVSFYVARATSTVTALASDASIGDSTIEVDSDASFADGDPIIISGEEFNWVDGTPASDVITLARPLSRGHAVDAVVAKATVYDMGPPLAEGVTWSMQGSKVDIPIATDRFPITTLPGFVDQTLSTTLPSLTPHLFAFAMGMNLTRVTGSGTEASPTALVTAGGEFGEAGGMVYIARAVTVKGDPLAVEAWNAAAAVESFSLNLSRGQATPLPVGCSSPYKMISKDAHDYTVTATYAAAAGSVWDALSEVGFYVDTPTTTTLSGAVSAGATAIVMASGASFSNGDTVKISGALGDEYHVLKDKSTNNFNTRWPVQRNLGSGVTITLVTPTKIAAVAPAGVTMAVNTTSTPVNSAVHSSPIHRRVGTVTITLSTGIIDVTLENLAYCHGVPQGDIVGATRFLADETNIGSVNVDGFYLKGRSKNGDVIQFIGAGCQIDLTSFTSTWTNQGEASSIPFTAQPTSNLVMLQYTPA